MKTLELSGHLLDYWATIADGTAHAHLHIQEVPRTGQRIVVLRKIQTISPSTSWHDGGAILGRMIGNGFGIYKNVTDKDFMSLYCCYKQGEFGIVAHGDTPLIAACRALVLDVLGDEVEDVEVTP